MKLFIGHFYPNLLNIYGDRGNIITLVKRCEWRNIEVEVVEINPGQKKTIKCDLYFGGGGQNQQQDIVSKDFKKQSELIKQEIAKDKPFLAICGTYQLLGKYFQTNTEAKIPGIGLIDYYTVAGNKRKIGNIVVSLSEDIKKRVKHVYPKAEDYKLVGFENHSGNTYLNTSSQNNEDKKYDKLKPLGIAEKGYGNNSSDNFEGAVFKNVVGTYLHGPILPKNPHLADFLIYQALKSKYQIDKLTPLNDKSEWQAHKAAIQRAYNPS